MNGCERCVIADTCMNGSFRFRQDKLLGEQAQNFSLTEVYKHHNSPDETQQGFIMQTIQAITTEEQN